MVTSPRISGAWPYLALTTIATLAWVAATFYPHPAGVFDSPAISTSVLPTVLLTTAGVLGVHRGRDWRTAITMMAIPPSIGVLSAAAFDLLPAPTLPTWPTLAALLSIVAIAIGLLTGAALRSVRHRLVAARS
ncbi:MAG TPA: hypothetical protein DCM67_06445 [Propionibacteriaceae bacterium]|nr:hypothetical protein [Propionibacteriaceae bacterium]